jgi:hypothetical protein
MAAAHSAHANTPGHRCGRGQRCGSEPQPQAPEPTASLDRGELLVIPYEDNLGAGVVGVVEQARQLTGAEHPRLVDRQHGPGVEHPLVLAVARDSPRINPGAERALDTSRITVAAGRWLTLNKVLRKRSVALGRYNLGC